MKTCSTSEMLNLIEGKHDTQDCVMLLGSRSQRTYVLACYDNEVWGSDPDGNFIDQTKENFINEYSGFKWSVELC